MESDFLEIGALAAYEMYPEEGGCPAAGVVTGVGKIHGRLCMIVANDATVKSRSLVSPWQVKKSARQEMQWKTDSNHLFS